MILSSNAQFLFHENQVIVANSSNGLWLRFSQECYQILNEIIERNIKEDDLHSYFVRQEDYQYINKLIKNLKKMNVLTNCDSSKLQNHVSSICWEVTGRCNLSCMHCSVSAENNKKLEVFDTEQCLHIAQEIVGCTPEDIIISGGEPLIREDFNEILAYLKLNSNAKITLMTNATLINDQNIQFLVNNIDSFDISLDGFNKTTCEYIRGKGVYDVVITNIKKLKNKGVKNISLSMVNPNSDLYAREQFNMLCNNLEVTPMIRRLSFVGRAKENETYLKNYSNLYESKPIQNVTQPTQKELLKNLKACSCPAGRSIDIDFRGNIMPCSSFYDTDKFSLGNISNIYNLNDFLCSEQYENLPGILAFKKFYPYSDSLTEFCKDCDVRYFCITCPYLLADLINSGCINNFCKERKEQLQSLIWTNMYE